MPPAAAAEKLCILVGYALGARQAVQCASDIPPKVVKRGLARLSFDPFIE